MKYWPIDISIYEANVYYENSSKWLFLYKYIHEDFWMQFYLSH